MKKKRVSAEDVAREAGVSRTTVSFVLNNTPGKNISETTRQRVLSAAETLGYTPNQAARNLAMSRRYTVGLFICHAKSPFSDAFIMRVIEGMNPAVNRHRVALAIQPTTFSNRSYLESASVMNLDGMVLINTHHDDPALEELVASRFPVVIIDFRPDLEVDQVYIDDRKAAAGISAELVRLGHRNIAMITHAPTNYGAARLRVAGFFDALAEGGLEPGPVIEGDFTESSGFRAMEELLSRDPPPTAVFVGNDVVAYGALEALRARRIAVPEEISIVGFDDDYISRFISPPLTTVALPAAGMGSTAVQMVVERIEGSVEGRARRVELPTNVSLRDSAAPPAASHTSLGRRV